MKRCTRCDRSLPLDDFFRRRRGSADGRESFCKDCDYERKKANGSLVGYRSRTPYNAKQRARVYVNRRVTLGTLPRSDALRCVDCGGPARQYDHHNGYDGEAVYDVEAVCTTCHGLRVRRRGEFANVTGRQAEQL